MDLTNEDVTDILALLDSLPYDELDLQTTRFRLILRRTPDGWTQSVQIRSAPEVLEAAPPAVAPGPAVPAPGRGAARSGSDGADEAEAEAGAPAVKAEAGKAEAGKAEAGKAEAGKAEAASGGADAGGSGGADADAGAGFVAVRAPLPGTFYRAPRPGAAPFVELGSQVGPDTVVGIVETMKLMNSVTAGVAGTVAEICLGNAEFATHGATLLRIRAD